MTRWKAAGIHFCISLAIGVIVGALLAFVWYPAPYFHAAGADELIVLLVGADLALGPLLTLIVFKSGKKYLRFDLVVIALLQTSALLYGLTVVLGSRPVFLVGTIDRFMLVAASDLDAADLVLGDRPEFRRLSWTGPRTIAARLPDSANERSDLIFSGLRGKDIDKIPKYYVPYADEAPHLLARAKALDAIPHLDAADRLKLDSAVAEIGVSTDRLVWLPVMARKQDLVMLMDRASGTPLRAVAIDPWDD